jgi:predicted NAD/FAD-dependent oxidoreductase
MGKPNADAKLAVFLSSVAGWPEVKAGKMFGWGMLKAGGSAFVLHKKGTLAIRIATEDVNEAFAFQGAQPFMPGDRAMRNWVAFLSADLGENQITLAQKAHHRLVTA